MFCQRQNSEYNRQKVWSIYFWNTFKERQLYFQHVKSRGEPSFADGKENISSVCFFLKCLQQFGYFKFSLQSHLLNLYRP